MLFIKTRFARASSDFCFLRKKFFGMQFVRAGEHCAPRAPQALFGGVGLVNVRHKAQHRTARKRKRQNQTRIFRKSVERGGCLKRRPELQKPEYRFRKVFLEKTRYFTSLARRFSYACQSVIGWRAAPLSIAAFATAEETFTIRRLSNGLGRM